ncbi:SAM-dependent methyltransferase [Cellulosimicrobium cellulans]|uniref:spermidine synthase n=1 Tax=Cellulosimicrobium cellulans TaxID=1710 RepID=UPI00195B1E42|nr:fused MFS/spermidine synthase [Cellulosimicrobium cellulans]MBM7819600.1 SAM-dependent methyltransferase [Cellulosimicrobium cellulans]
MARRTSRRSSGSSAPPTPSRRRGGGGRGGAVGPELPTGPVPTSTGTAHVERDLDHPSAVTLYVNGVPSSYLDLDDPGMLAFEYMQQMAAVVNELAPGPLRALHLGAAGCSLPRWVEHTRPGSSQLGVDLDARLLELVRTWFDLPRAPRLRLRPDDARHTVAGLPAASYDVVVRDVFDGDRTPDHLATRGMADEVHRVLRPGGVYLVNCADRPPLTTARRETATLAAAFGEASYAEGRVAAIAEPAQLKGRRYGNVVLAAVRAGTGASTGAGTGADAPAPTLSSATLARAVRSLAVPARVVTGDELRAFVGTAPVLDDPEGEPTDGIAAGGS